MINLNVKQDCHYEIAIPCDIDLPTFIVDVLSKPVVFGNPICANPICDPPKNPENHTGFP